MIVKVHYTFDRDAKINCLARHPNTLQVQTVQLDDVNSIGIIDLRACVHALVECSPELAGQDSDYTVYVVDYSEPDTPLVGQGMLSSVLFTMQPGPASQQPPKMVTGRVTKNLLAVFGKGNREILEVRLKLTESLKRQRPESQPNMDMNAYPARPMEQALTPTGSAEWNSFMQSNPQIGQTAQVSRVASPALSQHQQGPASRRGSFGPQMQQQPEPQRIAPTPVDAGSAPVKPQPSSRPSSRTSNRAPRRKPPTGRPRGRPRKNPVEGNTSGYEDGTEGEDGPAKKRAKTTVVDKTTNNAFGAGPDSLRISASTSGSLRNFRPVASAAEPSAAGHLQEIPRAPTPVPGASGSLPGRGPKSSLLRRGSTMMSQDMTSGLSLTQSVDMRSAVSPNSQDERSPESMAAATPAYSMDSPADIGSSPPVPLSTSYMRCTPVSSPVLPPMPNMFSQDSMTDMGMLPEAMFQIPEPMATKEHSFHMQDGPQGQDMMPNATYNTPQPTSTPAGPTESLPTMTQQPFRPQPTRPIAAKPTEESSAQQNGPTPPPTTDAVEKTPSPQEAKDDQAENTETSQRQQFMTTATAMETAQPRQSEFVEPKQPAQKPKKPRKMARSHSAGPLALPIPASEPAGPSGLAHAISAEPSQPSLRRANSTGPLALPIAASDPVTGPLAHSMPPPSDAVCPPSDVMAPSSPPAPRSNKNFVKKHAIKARLEEAILKGEMPPYCSNCGAIETPTWRKIWSQDHEGTPEYAEYSGEPGRITAIEITKRDDDGKPVAYRLIKKALGKMENKQDWQEILVCNPCGIWLGKYHEHRPRDRWDKDAARAGQERKRRNGGGASNSRAKKSRSKSDAQKETLEPAPTTDAPVPVDDESARQIAALGGHDQPVRGGATANLEVDKQEQPGSTHSRGNGSPEDPFDIDADSAMGTTKRLLFPSPRKDDSPKVLGELAINVVHTGEHRALRDALPQKSLPKTAGAQGEAAEADELEALFRSPGRPSTPPPSSKTIDRSAAFKTPTRPTPSQRPITRSVSRSMRSQRSIRSPNGQEPGTPSKTPRGGSSNMGSALRRRSPRNHEHGFEHVSETPITRSINQMLMSDPSGFLVGEHDLDFGTLNHAHSDVLDFGNFLSTDNLMPSSSPQKNGFNEVDFSQSHNFDWSQWDLGVTEAKTNDE